MQRAEGASYIPVLRETLELRFHGRGGQGAVTAATLLVQAALVEGKWGQAIPSFGAERRGAHVLAFARIAPGPVPLHSMVRKPQVLVVLDPGLLAIERDRVLSGFQPGGKIVANLPEPVDLGVHATLYYVNATRIAKELGLVVAGWPVVNTAMLGALARATGLVSIDSVVEAIKSYWSSSPKIAEANAEAARRAYEETRMVQLAGREVA
ncbi:2-oxoacid:acceptor oxidoreductase family protein [Hyperthermus butylicus]|uniref:pyruvate synthase n=1 Tax=Hyperthermus butylicus (strain DSM 5456 / JCM 9403 / PLM1-5) TaxID=415426 RepID=A2BKS5_HYPBU|nr:2-oxoacid:acceptor oxidoreductase family protein [Hyperthermus butylicus]ABM80586.1 pyruvate oxidoreductase gamma subunit [Hyperthermus butylicus DSM 5456]